MEYNENDCVYRHPVQWKDGVSGTACIAYKGSVSYAFGRTSPITAALNNLKVGESYTFDDEFWGQKRLMTLIKGKETWNVVFTTELDSPYPKKIERGLFNGSSAKGFTLNLKKAMLRSYYDDEIIIYMVPEQSWHLKNYRENGKITVFLDEHFYIELETFYNASINLEDEKCGPKNRKSFIKFQENFQHLCKVQLSRRTSFKYFIYFSDYPTEYVDPKSVTFGGRCQCQECLKCVRFQNAEQIRAQQKTDVDTIINYIINDTETSFILCVIPKYINLITSKIATQLHEDHLLGQAYQDFIDGKTKVLLFDDNTKCHTFCHFKEMSNQIAIFIQERRDEAVFYIKYVLDERKTEHPINISYLTIKENNIVLQDWKTFYEENKDRPT